MTTVRTFAHQRQPLPLTVVADNAITASRLAAKVVGPSAALVRRTGVTVIAFATTA
jgi:hypothetical protein